MTTARTEAIESSAAWRLSDRIGLGICWALGLAFCAIAGAIVIYMMLQGLKYVRLDLVFSHAKVGFGDDTGGFLDALIGTGIVAGLGMLIALPLGVAIAIWLTEFGRPFWLARIVESTVEMIAGTPSIVLALFGTLIFSNAALGFLSRSTTEGVVFGRSFLAAGAMLSLVALPLVVSSVREGLNAIPQHIREASYAVGKTKAATTRRILLPAIRPSVATGTMLGLGRIIGDTAIIVILLGATINLEPTDGFLGDLRGTGSTLTSYVYANAPTGALNNEGKAYAAAFVLMLIVLLLNVAVDVVHRRARKAGSWNS
jgi:phosphate transport system permease protein